MLMFEPGQQAPARLPCAVPSLQYDQAIAFPVGTNPALVSTVNRALVALKEMGESSAFLERWRLGPLHSRFPPLPRQ